MSAHIRPAGTQRPDSKNFIPLYLQGCAVHRTKSTVRTRWRRVRFPNNSSVSRDAAHNMPSRSRHEL